MAMQTERNLGWQNDFSLDQGRFEQVPQGTPTRHIPVHYHPHDEVVQEPATSGSLDNAPPITSVQAGLPVREVMNTKIEAAGRDSTLQEVARIMKHHNCGIVPITDESDRLLGVVTDRDLVLRALETDLPPSSVPVREVMTPDVITARPEEDLHDVVARMTSRLVRRIPVVDQDRRLVGMLSITDIARRADRDHRLQDLLMQAAARRSFWYHF